MKKTNRAICLLLCAVMLISVLPLSAVFAASCNHTYENVIENGRFAYYGCSECGEVVDTKPVIYFANIGGDNSNDGFTDKKPVKTMLEAFSRLAEYGVGGTAVMCGQSLINASFTLADAGDEVTVTSYYNDVDYRETNKACLITVYGVYFNSDVVFDNVSFVVTGSAKSWYLQYNDLTITAACGLYTNKSGSSAYTESKPPVAGTETVSYCLNLITGYKSDSAAVASGVTKAEQKIVLNGACFNILAGNKEAETTVGKFCHKAGPDASLDGHPVVRTNIYIGEGASVGAIDLFPTNNQTTKVYFTDGQTDLSYRQYAGGASVASSTISGYSASTTYVFMDMEDGDASKPEEMIHIIDGSNFTSDTVQKRADPVPNPAMRVPFSTSAAWVDNSDAPVAEFGVLMALEANKDKIAYQSFDGYIGGTVGRSVAYDGTRSNYFYAGGDTPVTFYGVLEYEKQGYEDKTFTAVPYGVVNSTAIGGKYTVLGDAVSFEYGREDIPDGLDELDRLIPYDGEKLRIACIGDSITQGTGVTDKEKDSYPAQLQALLGENYVVGNFGKGGSYVLKFESEYNTGHDNPALSYKSTEEFPASLEFSPDVVVIMLGTNDMRNMTSDGAKAEFKDTLLELVKTYEVLSSVKKIYLCTNIHALSSAMADQLSSGEMSRLVKETAQSAGCGFIDVNAVTFEYMSVYMNTTSDRLHPAREGYGEIAKAIEAGIRGKEADITVPEVSDSGVVYVRADGMAGGKGATYETAVNDLAAAVSLLRNSGGTVVVCGPVAVDYNMFLPDTANEITVTSDYNDVDYRETQGAKIDMSLSLYLNGAFTFENVTMHMTATNVMFVCNYNDVTIGSGVACTVESTYKYPVFVAGVNVGNAGSPDSEIDFGGNCSIVINSGEWQYIRAGNRRQTGAYPIGRILDGASLTITVNGGTFHNGGSTAPSAATGMNSVYGTCSLIINGGTFNSDIYAVGRVGTNSGGFANEMAGTVNIEINGGTITGNIKAILDTTSNVTGKVNITCASAYESRLDKTDFTNVVIK